MLSLFESGLEVRLGGFDGGRIVLIGHFDSLKNIGDTIILTVGATLTDACKTPVIEREIRQNCPSCKAILRVSRKMTHPPLPCG